MEKRDELSRKCACCKETIPLDENSIGKVVRYDKKHYHKNCFADLCLKRMGSNNAKSKERYTKAYKQMDQFIEETDEIIKAAIIKDKIYRHILNAYGIQIVPNSIFVKLERVYQADIKGMTIGIPPEHLLDMWITKQKYLDKVYQRNIQLGKEMTEVQRVNYDISILVGKYNDYLKYLEKSKIIEAENRELNSEPDITSNVIASVQVTSSSDDNDISDLVDDIFG